LAQETSIDALDFASLIRPGDFVVWGQASAEPVVLTDALMRQRHIVGPFTAFIGMTWSPVLEAACTDFVSTISYCGSGRNRQFGEHLDIMPLHYSALPAALAERVDVLMLCVAPEAPDGTFSLGTAHEYLVPLIEKARVVIAEVNDRMPWTFGERSLSRADIDIMVRTSRPLVEDRRAAPGDADEIIARHVASLVEDGATLQIGLGSLPDAVLRALRSHRDLGIHSGLVSDGVVDLIEAGAVTNARKTIDVGFSVAGLACGSHRLFDHIHVNQAFLFRSTGYTHALSVLERIDRLTAVNAAIEADLTGQINAEVAAGRYVGAVGGAMDFIRGAHRSHGGLPIVCLPARATGRDGPVSRIVARLNGPVSTPRADAGIFITEFGIADLRGLSLKERRRRMIDIAAPEFREALSEAAAAQPS